MSSFEQTVRGARFLDSVPLHLKKIADGAEDFYGDGQWWEVGIRKGHEPCYGLKLL